MFSGVAVADRGGNRGRGHNKGPVVRDHRSSPPHRANRPARRADRRVIDRQTVRATDGRFVFANGTTRVYRRPVIRTHYRNARVCPWVIRESYRAEPGYVWVRGRWTWVGSEWQTYYDDGSYDYSPTFRIGASIRIGG